MKKIKRSVRRHGSILDAFKAACCSFLGISKYKENIDTLYFFLNSYCDITKLPPTVNQELRIIQLCDVELLRIFDEMCRKYGLTYWLYGGTLLGAVRHKGFIPWDDDMDISMPREDYEKAVELFPRELKKYGIESHYGGIDRWGLGYNHYKTGIWIDIFPVDHFHTDFVSMDISQAEMRKKEKIVHDYFVRNQNHITKENMDSFRNKTVGDNPMGKNAVYYDGMEFTHNFPRHYDECEIFPLTKLDFEGYKFNVPCNYHSFLTKMYKNYMSFPHSGVCHHGNEAGQLVGWAKNNNINMQEILQLLRKVRLNQF